MNEEKIWTLNDLFDQYEQPWLTKENLGSVLAELDHNYPEVDFTLEKLGDRYRFQFVVPVRIYRDLKNKPMRFLKGLSNQDAEILKKLAEKVEDLT